MGAPKKEEIAMDIVERVKTITLSPATAWPVIEAEQHTPQSLFVPYMLILAAIPAVATFIGMSLVGMGGFGFSMRLPIMSGLAMMVTSYVLSLAMAFGMGWLVSTLAPNFGGQSNLMQGLKLVVFGGTPMFLAGILSILPALGILGLVAAIYSLYVMYLGLPVLMKNPKEKTIPYMVVLVVCGFIGGVVMAVLSSAFTPSMGGMKMGGMGGAGTMGAGDMTISTPAGNAVITTKPSTASPVGATDTASISIKTPEGEIKIDMKNMEALTKQMQDMAAQMEKGKK
jgi:Yip1 domain